MSCTFGFGEKKRRLWGREWRERDPAKIHRGYYQINARAVIGQSAVGYCAGKPTEKSRVL